MFFDVFNDVVGKISYQIVRDVLCVAYVSVFLLMIVAVICMDVVAHRLRRIKP